MARCPFASWRRLPGTEPSIVPRTVIFHTMVGYLVTTDDYFRSGRSGGIESHFGVGGRWGADGPAGLDGDVWQWRDTVEQADANRLANDFAVSVETADNAPFLAADLAPWTPAQLASLIRLGRWLADTHSIPRRICRTPTDGGFGWHAMWSGTSYMLADGTSPWTPSRGKVCPGAARIAQLKTVVFPAIFAPAPPLEDDLFEQKDRDQLIAIYTQITGAVAPGQSSFSGTIEATLQAVQTAINEGRAHTGALDAALTTARVDNDEQLALVLAALARMEIVLSPPQVAQLAGQLQVPTAAIVQAAALNLQTAA